jgi:dihydrofolate synthase / folylpolyglutamate synthase
MHIIKVAGTNGKGSVCAMLEACLGCAGQRVGMFTSPHLSRITERFRIAGAEVALDELDAIAQEVLRVARRLAAKEGEVYVPSFFEALIVMAILLFHEHKVNTAIIEAGVGGYTDATSLLPAEIAVITSIGLDHQKELGGTLAAIAADKAGIATAADCLILGPDIPPDLRAIIANDTRVREIAVRQAQADSGRVRLGDLRHPTRIEVNADGETLLITLPLLGRHQVSNFATVTATVQALAQMAIIGGIECLAGVELTTWAGRLEVCDTAPRIILDAAHNEHGLRALAESLDDLLPYGERVLLYGASLGKDYESCLPLLPRLAPETYLVEGFYRARSASSIAARLPAECGYAQSFPSPRQAVEYFNHYSGFGGRTLIAAGSIFMIGELKSYLAARAQADDLS